MPWMPFLSHESDWLKFRNSFLIVWKRLGIVRTTFEKNRYQRFTKGGTTGPDFKSFGPPLPLTENVQMPWMPFLSDESDWFKFRNSFLIVWKRLGIVRTTFEKNRYQRGDHRAWFQILISNPLVPPYPLTKGGTTGPDFKSFGAPLPLIFKCLECRFYQMKVIGFKFRNSFLIVWKRLGIVRTTFEKNRYQRGDHRAWFQILWSPLTFDRKFSNALNAVFITWKWLV